VGNGDRWGLVFTADMAGTVYAFDAKTDKTLWKDDGGAATLRRRHRARAKSS
jgi:glucose dehydrogenase